MSVKAKDVRFVGRDRTGKCRIVEVAGKLFIFYREYFYNKEKIIAHLNVFGGATAAKQIIEDGKIVFIDGQFIQFLNK